MSENFVKIVAMLMAEGVDFTLEQGITQYYLIQKENGMTIWELDDGVNEIYFYNEMGKKYTFYTNSAYVFAIQSAITRFYTHS